MRWFGRRAARGDARPVMGRGFSVREATGQWPSGYEAQVRDAYLGNPVAQRAVRIVCEGVEAAPVAETAPDLERVVRPVLATVAAHLLLHGNAFVTTVEEVGREAVVRPAFSTMIATGGGGHEQRAVAWADARMEYDAGPGVRSEDDLVELIGFFRARWGAARGFRFRDPFDADAADMVLGTGDGIATRFALVKRYGGGGGDEAQVRRITRPVAGSVTATVDGVPAGGWRVEPGGVIAFAMAPAAGAVVRASFAFDVPVRFAEDRLEVSRSGFLAGEVASVPLVEVREG